MFTKFVEKIKTLAKDEPRPTPAAFDDPVARMTEWTPLKSGGANFCTHRLHAVSAYRVEFRPTTGVILFCLLFFLAGLGILIGFGYAWLFHKVAPGQLSFILPTLMGLLFAGLGGALLASQTKPFVFDKLAGQFWTGKGDPSPGYDPDNKKTGTPLHQIQALQLVSERVSGSEDHSSYTSYELNLVLKDGHRVNAVDHGNLDTIRRDAATLAGFLGVPLWDAL